MGKVCLSSEIFERDRLDEKADREKVGGYSFGRPNLERYTFDRHKLAKFEFEAEVKLGKVDGPI